MLEINFDRFVWRRPASRRKGFTWQGAGDDMQLVAVPGAALKEYRPDPALFRTFASLDETPEAIGRFANRYGLLRERPEVCPLVFWRQGISEMRQAVALQDALDASDPEKVRKNIQPFLAYDTEAAREIRKKLATGKRLTDQELFQAAVLRLLYGAVGELKPEVAWDIKARRATLHLAHPDLLAFMRFQLAHALIARRRFGQCRACGGWFRLDPRVNRADRLTCSNSCRFARYRQRKREAVELRARGMNVRQIVKELGVKPQPHEDKSAIDIVKSWIASE
jgi:hypothetical protein